MPLESVAVVVVVLCNEYDAAVITESAAVDGDCGGERKDDDDVDGVTCDTDDASDSCDTCDNRGAILPDSTESAWVTKSLWCEADVYYMFKEQTLHCST